MLEKSLGKCEQGLCWLAGLHPRKQPLEGISAQVQERIKAAVRLVYAHVAGGDPVPRALLAMRISKLLTELRPPFMAQEVYLPFIHPLFGSMVEGEQQIGKLRARLRVSYHQWLIVPLSHYLEEGGWLALIYTTGKRHDVEAPPQELQATTAVYLSCRWAGEGLDQATQRLRNYTAEWLTEQTYPILEERLRLIVSKLVLSPLGWQVFTPLVAGGLRQKRRDLLVRVTAVCVLWRCPQRQARVLLSVQIILVTIELADRSFKMLREEQLICINLKIIYEERQAEKLAQQQEAAGRTGSSIVSLVSDILAFVAWRTGSTQQEERHDDLLPFDTPHTAPQDPRGAGWLRRSWWG